MVIHTAAAKVNDIECPSINGLFAKSHRYAKKIILRISNICLRLFFSHALILNKNPHLWMDTSKKLKDDFRKYHAVFLQLIFKRNTSLLLITVGTGNA